MFYLLTKNQTIKQTYKIQKEKILQGKNRSPEMNRMFKAYAVI